MFLEISHNSQENTCTSESFLIKLQATVFTEHLQATASVTSKLNNESLLKAKTDISIFLVCFVFIVTYSQQFDLLGIKSTFIRNSHLSYSFKVLQVSHFTIIKTENDSSLQE